jgi:hypothetical protein
MFRRFLLEGDGAGRVPLAVERKLLATGLELAEAGWARLTEAERLALCHLPVESEAEQEAFRRVAAGFAARAQVELGQRAAGEPAWAAPWIPHRLRQRLDEQEALLDDAGWRCLGEDERYALWALADAGEPFEALLAELGLLETKGPARAASAPAEAATASAG